MHKRTNIFKIQYWHFLFACCISCFVLLVVKSVLFACCVVKGVLLCLLYNVFRIACFKRCFDLLVFKVSLFFPCFYKIFFFASLDKCFSCNEKGDLFTGFKMVFSCLFWNVFMFFLMFFICYKCMFCFACLKVFCVVYFKKYLVLLVI